MFDHAIDTWTGPSQRVRRTHRVFARDGWRCTVPGCSSYRNLHCHHVEPRSAGGSDDPDNCTTLCAQHHLRGVHGGTVRCRGRAPDGLRFELGVHPAGRPCSLTTPVSESLERHSSHGDILIRAWTSGII
jgi:hypothetical protein